MYIYIYREREIDSETKAALHSVVSSVRESGAEVLHAVVQSKKDQGKPLV